MLPWAGGWALSWAGVSSAWVVVRGSATGSRDGGEGQPDNKSPVRAMASGGLFSASVGKEGISSHTAQITCLLSTLPGLASAVPRFCALHSLSCGRRKEKHHCSSRNAAPGLGAPLLPDPGGRHKETSRKPASQTC